MTKIFQIQISPADPAKRGTVKPVNYRELAKLLATIELGDVLRVVRNQ